MERVLEPWSQKGVRDALLAGGAGVWEWNTAEDRVRLCSGAARLAGLSSEEGLKGLSGWRLDSLLVERDRDDRAERIRKSLRAGGLFVTQYRTRQSVAGIDRLLVRGRFPKDNDGMVRVARGFVVGVGDTTGRDLGDLEFTLADASEAPSAFDKAADYAMALWRLQEEPEIGGTMKIEAELRLVLAKIGRCLADDLTARRAQAKRSLAQH